MSYTRDTDHMTRGVGAIAAADHLRARRQQRSRVAQATRARDRAMVAVSRGALGRAAVSAATRPGPTYTTIAPPPTPGAASRAIASRNVPASTVTSVIGRGTVDHRTPVTSPPPAVLNLPTVSTVISAPLVFSQTPAVPSGDPQPTHPQPTDPLPTPLPKPVTTSGGATTSSGSSASSGGGGSAGVAMGPAPAPINVVPPTPDIELPDVPTSSGPDNTVRNVLLIGGALAAAYFIFRRKRST